MNQRIDLTVHAKTRAAFPCRGLVVRAVKAAWPYLEVSSGWSVELGVVLVGPRKMRSLNKKWRAHDEPTDVLSFPLSTPKISGYTVKVLGDLFICPEVVRKKARLWNRPVKAQMKWTIVHGILHLAGYDHPDAGRSGPRLKRRGEQMETLEQKILARIG